MSTLKDISSVYGGVTAVNRAKGEFMVTVHVAGVSFEVPGGHFLKRRRGRYPKVLVLYRRSGIFPEDYIIGMFVAPPSLVWRSLQEAARNDELTQEMILKHRPATKMY